MLGVQSTPSETHGASRLNELEKDEDGENEKKEEEDEEALGGGALGGPRLPDSPLGLRTLEFFACSILWTVGTCPLRYLSNQWRCTMGVWRLAR